VVYPIYVAVAEKDMNKLVVRHNEIGGPDR
jgi:hypothetical protein